MPTSEAKQHLLRYSSARLTFNLLSSYSGYGLFTAPFEISALGVALVRDSGALMVGQYFRRRRDAAEAALTASAGIGIAAVSCLADASMR